MKKIFILGLAAASMLTFASCETEAPTEKTPTDGVVEGIPTTATISLTNSGPSTMADDDASGTASESKITDATLFVFNNADVLESIVKFEAADITAKKVTFETTTGAKRLFACINMNDKVTAWNFKTVTTAANPGEITTLAQFKKKEQAIANFTDITADNNFWMTNLEAQPSQVTVTDAVASNKFTVNVGRACAKVSLAVGAGVTGSGGELSSVSYIVKQNPNKMYLMPVYNGTNYTGKQLLTPYYDAAASANNYISSASVVLNPATTAKPTYMTENSNSAILAGKATYLEVKGTWTPNLENTREANGSQSTVALTTGAPFWRIAQYDKTPTAPDAKITGYVNEFCYKALPTVQMGTNQAPVKFENGVCYYAIFVQDKNAGTDKELPLRYTIKRNSFFKVVITSISGPGSNDPGGVVPDPDKPVESTINMEVSIAVQNWTIADLNAGI